MEKYPPKFSKVLVTPDPHYIPGYAGYCPQLKYNLGKTYGQLTAKLLTSPEVAHSPRLVLHTGRFSPAETDPGPQDETWAEADKQLERIIPGYTGFIPKRQNYFSKTYAVTCREALREFYSDQKRIRMDSDHLLPAVSYSTSDSSKPRKLSSPLTTFSKEPATYKPTEPWKPLGSPYYMDDSSPHKYFISGFTGYVPRARFFIGTGYPITTNKALIQFGKELKTVPPAPGRKIEAAENLPPVSTIYSSHRGLLPSYTGHVPGYKFRYGHTFGQLTTKAPC